MDIPVQSYIHTLTRKLKLDPSTNQDIVLELQGHVEEKVQDLQEEGLTYEEAYARAITDLGHPDLVATGMYSVHSKGSWRDILLATLPHLFLASLFALHLWNRYLLIAVVVGAVSLVGLRGWKAGRPKWTYTWLGYSMAAPALSWMMALTAVGYGTWRFVTTGSLPFSFPIYLLLIAYVPFSLWVMYNVLIRVVRQDWLLASLTALPFPFLTSWLLFLNWQGGFISANTTIVRETDTDRALVFLSLAVTTGVFLKVGHRLVKIGLLTVSTTLLVMFTLAVIPISFGVFSMILVTLASIAFLLSPAVVRSRLDRGKDPYRGAIGGGQPGGEVVTHWFTNAP